MGRNILIADSGSTKTDWVLLQASGQDCRITTQGINPFMLEDKEIETILLTELLPRMEDGSKIDDIFFYGAGCRGNMTGTVTEALRHTIAPKRNIEVHSDLLGAARAACGHKDGLACILGTGSNSCLFIDGIVKANVSPLGFILGDEGSGAVLGRRLLGDVMKKQLPAHVVEDFHRQYTIEPDEIIRRVYREAFPNRFLASFTPFLAAHRTEQSIHDILMDEFCRFFHRNVDHYHRKDLKVNLVGSIAFYFHSEVEEAARRCGYTVGRTLKAPMDGLMEFHRNVEDH